MAGLPSKHVLNIQQFLQDVKNRGKVTTESCSDFRINYASIFEKLVKLIIWHDYNLDAASREFINQDYSYEKRVHVYELYRRFQKEAELVGINMLSIKELLRPL